MISSNDLIVFYVGFELQSLALYVLASFNRDNSYHLKSGLKYFVLSALSSGLITLWMFIYIWFFRINKFFYYFVMQSSR